MRFPQYGTAGRYCCLALLILLAHIPLAAEPLPGGTLYYASDAAAFQGQAVSGPADSQYVLAVLAEGSSQTRILYENGQELQRQVSVVTSSGRTDRIYKQNTLSEEDEYGISGELLSEKIYNLKSDSGPLLSERRVYSYHAQKGGQGSSLLSRIEAFDGTGASIGLMTYNYDARGRLSRAVASGSFGAEKAGASMGSMGLVASWTEIGGALFIASYSAGRPCVESLLDKDGRLIQNLSYHYDDSGHLLSTLKYEESSGLSTETDYDAGGRTVYEIIRMGQEIRSWKSWKYDEKSQLTLEEGQNGRFLSSTSYTYGDSGITSLTQIKNDGVLLSSETLNPDKSSVKELYDRGVLFLRVYSLNGKIVKEEFIKDGKVSRVKVY